MTEKHVGRNPQAIIAAMATCQRHIREWAQGHDLSAAHAVADMMAAYIDACEQAHQLGVDFTMASTHTGVSVPPSEASERLVSSMEALLKVFFTNKPAPVNRHSQAALKDHLQSLERLSLGFYNRACHIGNHAFIEFAGLLNEWIAMARQTLDAACDPFSGLVWRAHNLNYVIEKLDCITAAYAPDHAHHQAVRIRESITPAVCGVTT